VTAFWITPAIRRRWPSAATLAQKRPTSIDPVATTSTTWHRPEQPQRPGAAARTSFQEAAELYEEEAGRQPTARLGERKGSWAISAAGDPGPAERGWPDGRGAGALRKAVPAPRRPRAVFVTKGSGRRVRRRAWRSMKRLVEVCVDLWGDRARATALAEAVETAEKSRARRLMELLARETAPAREHPARPGAVPALRDQLQRAMLPFSMRPSGPGGGVDSPPAAEEGQRPGWNRPPHVEGPKRGRSALSRKGEGAHYEFPFWPWLIMASWGLL